MNPINPVYLNENGCFEYEDVEFNSGDVVEVFIEEEWRITRIEHSIQIGGFSSWLRPTVTAHTKTSFDMSWA